MMVLSVIEYKIRIKKRNDVFEKYKITLSISFLFLMSFHPKYPVNVLPLAGNWRFEMRPPHTLGIVCKAEHPAFADFLTDNYSDLQWWELLNRAQVMNLEDFPNSYRPLIQPIDTWFMNRKLGVLAEVNVKSGKLMICSADLKINLDKRLVAKQLRYILMKYMLSKSFNPTTTVDIEVIQNLLTKPSREQFNAYSKSSPDELRPNKN